METVFNYNKKIKPLVKVPDFKFIDFHNLQPGICYYIRRCDNHNNYDIMEARIERTANKVKNRYTLGAGTSVKVLDSFMYSCLKHKDEDISYDEFIDLTLKESGLDTEEYRKLYADGNIPKDFKNNKKFKALLNDGYSVLYVVNSKEGKIEQSYMVLVKRTKEKLIDTEIDYFSFKPVQIIVKMSYLKGEGKEKYNVFEFPDINIPVSILR